MSNKRIDFKAILDEMKGGNWERLGTIIDFYSENADKCSLGPRGTEYVKSILRIAKDYLDANGETDSEDLTKLNGVDAIIKTFSYYTDMGTFARGLPAKNLSTRVGYIMDVAQCKDGSVARLTRNELHALMYGISNGKISLENRSLNGDIVMRLIEKEVFTRQQILAAMMKAEMIADTPRETVIEVIDISGVPSFLGPETIIEILKAYGII